MAEKKRACRHGQRLTRQRSTPPAAARSRPTSSLFTAIGPLRAMGDSLPRTRLRQPTGTGAAMPRPVNPDIAASLAAEPARPQTRAAKVPEELLDMSRARPARSATSASSKAPAAPKPPSSRKRSAAVAEVTLRIFKGNDSGTTSHHTLITHTELTLSHHTLITHSRAHPLSATLITHVELTLSHHNPPSQATPSAVAASSSVTDEDFCNVPASAPAANPELPAPAAYPVPGAGRVLRQRLTSCTTAKMVRQMGYEKELARATESSREPAAEAAHAAAEAERALQRCEAEVTEARRAAEAAEAAAAARLGEGAGGERGGDEAAQQADGAAAEATAVMEWVMTERENEDDAPNAMNEDDTLDAMDEDEALEKGEQTRATVDQAVKKRKPGIVYADGICLAIGVLEHLNVVRAPRMGSTVHTVYIPPRTGAPSLHLCTCYSCHERLTHARKSPLVVMILALNGAPPLESGAGDDKRGDREARLCLRPVHEANQT